MPAVGITMLTAFALSSPFTVNVPEPPTQSALQPVRSVESDGVTAATLRAENVAVGFDGVKSGMKYPIILEETKRHSL